MSTSLSSSSSIWHAIRYGRTEDVALLIRTGRSPLEAVDSEQQTPLLLSLHQDVRKSRTARWLVVNGANINAANSRGWTPLMLACRYGLSEVAKLLIAKGAALDTKNCGGFTAIMLACFEGEAELVRIMAQRGASIDVDVDGWTPLMIAARYGHVETVKVLVGLGLGLRVDARNYRNNTALNLACQQCEELGTRNAALFECVKVLFKAGARLDIRNSFGRTPLETAMEFERREVVEFLEFVSNSEVAEVVRKELRLSRDVLVACFEEKLRDVQQCKQVNIENMHGLGISEPFAQQRFLKRFNPLKQQQLGTSW